MRIDPIDPIDDKETVVGSLPLKRELRKYVQRYYALPVVQADNLKPVQPGFSGPTVKLLNGRIFTPIDLIKEIENDFKDSATPHLSREERYILERI